MTIEIRVADRSDAGLLAELGRETFVRAFESQINHRDLIHYADQRFGQKQQTIELAEPGAVFFIGRHDGEVVGYAKLCASVPPPRVNASHAIELERLYLYSKWRGHGAARALMDVCLLEAQERSCDAMWLDVWDQNLRAEAFYRKYGFDIVGDRPYMVGSIEQRHLLMYREL